MKKKEFCLDGKSITVPGDKSLSHRFVIFASLSHGESECMGFLEAEDPLHTMSSFSKLGVDFDKLGSGRFKVRSKGILGLQSPNKELDFGNGGTGIRLSCGLLAGTEGMVATLTGDESLRKRPMNRIIEPLNSLGADVSSIGGDGKAPLRVFGKKIRTGFYESNIASAQVKSCLLFAAIASGVELEYKEPELSRDHTENMIRFLGGNLDYLTPTHFRLRPPYKFDGAFFRIPGDISSAAFFIVLGLLGDNDSVLKIENVGLNPSRMGIVNVLISMGGRIEVINKRTECGEITGDLCIYGSQLRQANIPESLIPSIIDEIPILTIAGLFSKGGFQIRHAQDLRAKESDRIHSMVSNLKKLGVPIVEYNDGYEFPEWTGEMDESRIADVAIESFMDHRIAMSFSILSFLIGRKIAIDDVSWVETSFPGFYRLLEDMNG